jgi:hypothetical protein
MALPPEAAQTVIIVTDPSTAHSYAQPEDPDAAIQARRTDLEFQIQNVDSEIYRQRLQEDSLRAANRLLQFEMAAL